MMSAQLRDDQEPAATETFLIPGTAVELHSERAPSGGLLHMRAAGRDYFTVRGTERIYDDGLAVVSEVVLPQGMLRRVRAAMATGTHTWVEDYLWDAQGRPVRIDGVTVERDDQHRVTACRDSLDDTGDWLYAYAGGQLTVIAGPDGGRHVARGARGRPIRLRTGTQVHDLAYDASDRREDIPALPTGWHRDDLGRLWTIAGPGGAIQTTYLWDGYACLGRIDGPPGAPLAAVYTLDPSCTPVRIITRAGVTRIPRDAYGEALLRHAGVPGLYGGAIYGGYCHYRSRTLDPRAGAFDRPDPWHGLTHDPRRADGYRGPLLVEHADAGPYTVCCHDPVGRMDPTGEVSVWLLLSDFTWGLQNNVAGWFGLDWTINFLMSMVVGIGVHELPGQFFSFEGLSSSGRLGSFGLRRSGFTSYLQWGDNKKPEEARAWTYGHLVHEPSAALDKLNDVRVFTPTDAFRPGLYGTLLRIVHSTSKSFLLRGDASANGSIRPSLLSWSRAGGSAESVIPGVRMPHFPHGGLHFDATQDGLRGPLAATLTELAPTAVLGLGTLLNRTTVVIHGKGLGLALNDLLLVTDNENGAAILTVQGAPEEGNDTRVLALPPYASRIAQGTVRVRSLNPAPAHTQTLSPARDINNNPVMTHLNVLGVAPAVPYAPNDPVRVSQNAQELAGGLVQRFETQLSLDTTPSGGPDPPTAPNTSAPLQVYAAVADAAVAAVTVTVLADPAGGTPTPLPVLQFPAGQVPAPGTAGEVTNAGGARLDLVILSNITGLGANQRRIDRDVTAGGFTALGTSLSWQQLKRDVALGSRNTAPDNTATLTYQPNALGAAPAAGLVWVEGFTGKAVRRVTGVRYEAIVLNLPLPGDPAQIFTVDRFGFKAGLDAADAVLTRVQEITLTPPVTLTGVALQLQRYAGATASTLPTTAVPASLVAPGLTIAAATPAVATGLLNAGGGGAAPAPSQVVVLNPGPAAQLAVVKTLRLTVTLDRALTLNQTTGLQAVPLATYSPVYNALRQGLRRVRVLAATGTPALAVAAPVLRRGERIALSGTGFGGGNYVVAAVTGDVIDLAPGAGVDIPPGTLGLVLTRTLPNDWPYDAARVDGQTVTVLPTDALRRLPADPVAATVAADPGGGAAPVLQFTGFTPALGDEGIVRDNTSAATRVAVITADAGGGRFRVDSDLTSGGFAAVGNAVTWQQLRAPGGRVQMPRLRLGELVEVSWGDTPPGVNPPGTVGTRHYRITAVDGTTVTLAGDAPLDAVTQDLLVTRLTPADPQTGGSRLGLNGTALAGTNQIRYDVWRTDAFTPGRLIAVADGDRCHAAVVDRVAQQAVEVEFTAAPGITGAVAIGAPSLVDGGYSVQFRQPDFGHLELTDEPAALLNAGGSLVAVLPFAETPNTITGQLHPGSVLVPEDPEYPELTRRQSLIDHELTHTLQCARYGPLLLGAFPHWAVDLILQLATDVEEPKYSAYVAGEVSAEGSARLLTLADPQGIAFAANDTVEISRGSAPERYKLGTRREDNRYVLLPGPSGTDIPVTGAPVPVQVRRENGESVWSWYLNIAPLLSLGGITKIAAGFTYGGLALGLAKAFYGLYRLIKGRDTTYPAEVIASGAKLRLQNDAARDDLHGARQILVQGGGRTLVRTLTGVEDRDLALDQPVDVQGTVQVARFATHTPNDLWDWHDYYPASIPDPARPARLRYGRVNDERLQLDPFDRVLISDGARTHTTYVTAVEPETPADPDNPPLTRVELAEPPFVVDPPRTGHTYDTVVEPDGRGMRLGAGPDAEAAATAIRAANRILIYPYPNLTLVRPITGVTGGSNTVNLAEPLPDDIRGHIDIEPIANDLRIAKIGSRDAVSDLDNAVLHWVNMDWMRWLFDPWGNIPFRAQPRPGSFWDVLTRIGRYAFSTQSWTIFPPLPQPFWWFWWDRVFFGRSGDKDYLSQMEQEASEESGNLYSALSRLNGEHTYVGDLARFWHWPDGSALAGTRQDAPGVHLIDRPRVAPALLVPATPGAGEPNQGAGTDPARAANAGAALPDALFAKSAIAPHQVPATNPASFPPGAMGWIPVSAALDLSQGIYVAFSRPGTHRVTVANQDGYQHSREAQQETKFASSSPLQTIYFEVTTQDVSVKVAGMSVTEGATLRLLQTQRANVSVEPGGERRYALTVPRGAGRAVLDTADDGTRLAAGAQNGSQPVEVSRVYRYDGTAYDAGGAAHWGTHLPDDLLLPVRGFSVTVTDIPPVFSSLPDPLPADPYANPVPALSAGRTVFVLVPATAIAWDIQAITYPGGAPAFVTNPAPATDPLADLPSVPQGVRDFIGDGRVFPLVLAADDAPEEEGVLTFHIRVGVPTLTADVRATIPLHPHFRLTAASFEVAAGASLSLACTDGVVPDNTLVRIVGGPGVTTSINAGNVVVQITAGTAAGTRQILVTNPADHTQVARRTLRIT